MAKIIYEKGDIVQIYDDCEYGICAASIVELIEFIDNKWICKVLDNFEILNEHYLLSEDSFQSLKN